MPPQNPRKRAAPGGAAALQQKQSMPQQEQQQQQAFMPSNPAWGITDDGNNTALFDPNTFNLAAFGGNQTLSNPSFQPVGQTTSASSTQLARRPAQNRQLVQTGSRPFETIGNSWDMFGEDGFLDPQSGAAEENDNLELLEERAVIAKRDAQSKRKQIPPFVQKLSSFLDDGKNTELIRWSDRGDSFIVLDEDEFAKTLIPELFKHNNYASFVRQLNMYGFHKRVGLSDNSMKASERKNKSPSEYSNPYFRRGHPNLLWLINKPKGGTGQKKGGRRGKTEDGEGGSDDEGIEAVEATYSNQYGQDPTQTSRAISAAPEQSGPLQRREMTVVQNQLQDIQKQQAAISNAISRLRKDHNQLYQQAMAFQTLHDRHENSINAILTFLATVYNRSLDGQGPQNMAQMFANIIPQDHPQGNIVEMPETNHQQQPQPQTGNLSPMRRHQRLLMAPPVPGQSSKSSTPIPNQNYQPGAIEELFESSPTADSPQIKTETPNSTSQQSMLNLINNTNASHSRQPSNSNKNNIGMNFPDVLSHYETANGNSPLTNAQRNDMLSLIANQTSNGGPGSNNALVSPNPPAPPSLESLGYTTHELNELVRMQQEQEEKLHQVQNIVQPLSPSGSIPGLDVNSGYFTGNGDVSEMGGSQGNNLDLDQFLDTGAYFGNGGDGSTGDTFNFDGLGSTDDVNDFDFGLGGTGNHLQDQDQDHGLLHDHNLEPFSDGGRIENLSSGAATPDTGFGAGSGAITETDSPEQGSSKKRRRN